MSLLETFRCECGYEQGPFGTHGYDPATGTGELIGCCPACRVLGVLRMSQHQPSSTCRCGKPLETWDGSCPRCGSKSCGFQLGGPSKPMAEAPPARTDEDVARDRARWAAEKADAEAGLQHEKEEIRRRAIEAGMANEQNVDEVLAKMDVATFKRLRGNLERVARMHFRR